MRYLSGFQHGIFGMWQNRTWAFGILVCMALPKRCSEFSHMRAHTLSPIGPSTLHAYLLRRKMMTICILFSLCSPSPSRQYMVLCSRLNTCFCQSNSKKKKKIYATCHRCSSDLHYSSSDRIDHVDTRISATLPCIPRHLVVFRRSVPNTRTNGLPSDKLNICAYGLPWHGADKAQYSQISAMHFERKF